MLEEIFLLILLAILAWEDIRTKRISVRLLMIASGIAMILFLYRHSFSLWSLFGGIGVGLFLILFSVITGGVGFGDGWLFCVTGMFLGFQGNVALLMTALLLSAGYAVILLLRRRCERKKEFAFLPFVLAAYLLLLVFNLKSI